MSHDLVRRSQEKSLGPIDTSEPVYHIYISGNIGKYHVSKCIVTVFVYFQYPRHVLSLFVKANQWNKKYSSRVRCLTPMLCIEV